MIVTSNQARRMAKRRLPRLLFEYLDSGASSEQAMARNTADFERILLSQRVLVDITAQSMESRFLDTSYPTPLVLGPVGLAGIFRRDGEILAARAAHALGLPYCLSMFSVCTLPALRAATDGPLWCQLYITRDETIFGRLLEQARSCGVDTICITVDTPSGSFRPRDIQSGMRGATWLTPRMLASFAARPRWCLDMLPGGMPRLGSLAGIPAAGGSALVQAAYLGGQIDGSFDWQRLQRLRDRWRGKLILKGVTHVDDAVRAAQCGVDALVVSNHGGRQADFLPSTIAQLPAIAAAVGDRMDVMLDSGVRSGVDVVKALALGAKAVWIGRPYAYALAADGQRGVSSLLSAMISEIDSSLAHAGAVGLRALRQAAASDRFPFSEISEPDRTDHAR